MSADGRCTCSEASRARSGRGATIAVPARRCAVLRCRMESTYRCCCIISPVFRGVRIGKSAVSSPCSRCERLAESQSSLHVIRPPQASTARAPHTALAAHWHHRGMADRPQREIPHTTSDVVALQRDVVTSALRRNLETYVENRNRLSLEIGDKPANRTVPIDICVACPVELDVACSAVEFSDQRLACGSTWPLSDSSLVLEFAAMARGCEGRDRGTERIPTYNILTVRHRASWETWGD